MSAPPPTVRSNATRPATRLSLDDPRWSAFVDGHPQALAFHRPAWTRVLARTYRFDAFVLATLDGADVTAGIPVVDVRLPRRRQWVSLPFTDACPPLLGPLVDAASFLDSVEAARRVQGCELQIRASLHGDDIRESNEAVTHELTLGDDPDLISAGFHQSQRRNIRRAAREHVEVRRADAEVDLTRVFYQLHTLTRHRLGVPVQPRRFFAEQWRELIEPGYGRLLLAYAGGAPVAGMVLLLGNGTVTYKFGASDADSWAVRPNHALFGRAIREACLDGNHTFDFGRSDFEDQSLRDFKASWGAQELPLRYSTLGASPSERRVIAGRASGLSRTVLRRSPRWVGRAAGAVLYRYTA